MGCKSAIAVCLVAILYSGSGSDSRTRAQLHSYSWSCKRIRSRFCFLNCALYCARCCIYVSFVCLRHCQHLKDVTGYPTSETSRSLCWKSGYNDYYYDDDDDDDRALAMRKAKIRSNLPSCDPLLFRIKSYLLCQA